MNLATLCHDEATSTWYATFNGETVMSSVGGESSRKYIIERITQGKSAKCRKLGIVGFDNVREAFAPNPLAKSVSQAYVEPVKANNELSVQERYDLLDECVEIVLQGHVTSLIITGLGGLGKTYHTKAKIKEHNLVSVDEAKLIEETLSEEDRDIIERIELKMAQCKYIAEAFYKTHDRDAKPLKKAKSKGEDDDEPEEELELELNFGKVSYDLQKSDDIKDRRCAGQYYPGTHAYRFNLTLAKENLDDFIEIVVPHEIAHQIDHILHPKESAKAPHGKNWQTVMTKCFKIPGDRYHTYDTSTVKNTPELKGDYHYMKGYSSAKGLYRTLYENRKKLVVFDDCDAAWKNEVGANILKAALDTDEDRWVTWNVEQNMNDDLPTSFLFEGRVIFISNVRSQDFPQPLVSRALRADIELTTEETFERMRQLLSSDSFAPGISMEVKQMGYDFLYENRDRAAELTTRSLLNVIKVANTGSKLWKRIALSNIQ